MSEQTDVATLHKSPDANSELKRHAACDECRKRKLKCSGDLAGCSRCVKQSIECHYSVQKPMGRPPKKRARVDDDESLLTRQPSYDFWPSPQDTPPDSSSGAPFQTATTDAQHLCPHLFWLPPRQSSQHLSDRLSGSDSLNYIRRPDGSENPNLPVPPSSSPWPDFSAVSEATAMPFPMPTTLEELSSLPLTPSSISSSDIASFPQCTCLSYLYLCLSQLSSIASFPISSHTLSSLYIAARTAQDVVRCESCPKNFATGVQNVMFLGTLLTVVADAWLRVSKSDAASLAMQTAEPDFVSRVLQTDNPAQYWSCWLRQIVRRAVIGGPHGPEAEIPSSNQRDLLSLISEMENRQRRWHEPGQHPCPQGNPLTPQSDSGDSSNPIDEQDLLCLRVARNARAVLTKFNFAPDEFPEGVIPDDLRSN